MDFTKAVGGQTINLPLIGAISIPVAILLGVGGYMLLRRRKRVTSVTTRYGK